MDGMLDWLDLKLRYVDAQIDCLVDLRSGKFFADRIEEVQVTTTSVVVLPILKASYAELLVFCFGSMNVNELIGYMLLVGWIGC